MIDPNLRALDDELFCTRFELQTVSAITLRKSLERWVPGFTSDHTHVQHERRYEWSCQFANGKRVLDIACGVGRGSLMLAQAGAGSVVAVDIDADTVRYARVRNGHPNITYLTADAATFQRDEPFDLIVSFETIEHLRDVHPYLLNVRSLLAPGGLYLVSTPISHKDLDRHPTNPHHFQEWGLSAYAELLSGYFDVSDVYLQLRKYPLPPLLRPFKALLKSLPLISDMVPVDIKALPPPSLRLAKKLVGYQIAACRPKAKP